VQVFIWDKDAGKDVGHTAIRIDNKVYGFYPTGGKGEHGYTKSELWYSKGSMHVDKIKDFNERYKDDIITYFQLKLTPEQIEKLQEILKEYVDDPGHYSLAGSQCTSVAVNALLGAGVKIQEFHNNHGDPGPSPVSSLGISPSSLNSVLRQDVNKIIVTRVIRFVVGK
jgi:hypothetical protein